MDPFISADEQHEIAQQQQQQRAQAHDVPAAATHSPQQQTQMPTHSPSASLLPPSSSVHLTASPSSGNAPVSTPLSAGSAASLTSSSGLVPSTGSSGVVVFTSPASRVAALKSAASVWRSIGLDALRSVIDASALSMASEEDRSLSARKALATQTKAFRALPEEAQVSQVGPMVKAYQSEVNELTRRSKAAEAAFLQLYRLLLDAPDPFPLLSDAALGLESLSATEEALAKTRATLSDCEAEFTGLKNQEVSIRKLESEKRELESNLSLLVARGVEERSRASEAEMALTKRAYEEREQMLQSKLDHFREQLSASLSASNHLASLAAARDRSEAEQIESASRSDRKFYEAELERAHCEVAALTKEISALRSSSSQHQQNGSAHDDASAATSTHSPAEIAALVADRARLEEELASLQSKLDAADSASHAASAKLEAATRDLATLRSESQAAEEKLRAQIDALKAELSTAPSLLEFQELKRNLSAMQEIQYSSRREDEHEPAESASAAAAAAMTPAAASASPASGSAASAAATPSQVLLAKTRRLESELTSLKLSHSALESAQSKSAAESLSLRTQLTQAREALAKVEHDLAESNSMVSEGMFKASTASATATAAVAAVALRPNAASNALPLPPDFSRPTASAATHLRTPTPVGSTAPSDPTFASLSVDIPDASPIPPPSVGGASAAAVASAVPLLASLQAQLAQSTSMLRIVLAQRDRYRSQLDAVEADRATASADLERARTESATLRKENLQLYEKLQYVKSLSGAGSGAAGASSSSSASSLDRKMALSGASSHGADIESGFGGIGSGALSRGGAGAGGSAADSEAKYKLLYDEKLNPFAAFKARARAEREKALSQSERVTLAVGRALFSKKSARTALFAYALVLHLLVMVVLWTHTVSSHCGKEKGGLGEHEH